MLPIRRWLGDLALSIVALVVAHDVVFLLAYGDRSGQALAATGHSAAWTGAVALVLAAAAGLLGVTLWRLRRLGTLAARLGGGPGAAPVARGPAIAGHRFGAALAALWLRLGVATSVLFVVQENLERAQPGRPLPGLGVLGTGGPPWALAVIALTALAVAVAGALLRWRHEALVTRIAALRRLRLRAPATIHGSRPAPDRRPRSVAGRGFAANAPPLLPAR